MGQYHKLTCPSAGTCVTSFDLGSFTKALEQIWSPGPPAALAFLCAGPRGNHARDLPWAPAGAWAGHAPMMIGDYAEPGDLLGADLPDTEDNLYGAAGQDTARLGETLLPSKAARDLSPALRPVIERVFGARFSNVDLTGQASDRWGDLVDVRPCDQHPSGWDVRLPADDPESHKEILEYYERMGLFSSKTAWRRAPIQMPRFADLPKPPDAVPDAKDAGPGDALIWVNVDRGEFLCPEALGDVPDMAGVMEGDAARAVMAMICHHRRRGGGDIGDAGPLGIAGRWRGERIALIGPRGLDLGGEIIRPDDVRRRFVDITACARVFLRANEIFGEEHFGQIGQAAAPLNPEGELRTIAGIVLRFLHSAAADDVMDGIDGMAATIRIVPPMRLPSDAPGLTLGEDLDLPGYVELRSHADGKVLLDVETHRLLSGAVARLPRCTLRRSKTEGNIDRSDMVKIDLSALSNHQQVALIAAE